MSSEAKPALTVYTAAKPNGLKISVALGKPLIEIRVMQ